MTDSLRNCGWLAFVPPAWAAHSNHDVQRSESSPQTGENHHKYPQMDEGNTLASLNSVELEMQSRTLRWGTTKILMQIRTEKRGVRSDAVK